MGLQRPASVTNAIRVQMALVAVSGLTTLLTVLQRDDLIVAWAEGNPTARSVLEEGGLDALLGEALREALDPRLSGDPR